MGVAIVDQPETAIALAAAWLGGAGVRGPAIGRYLTADIEYVARQEMIQVLMYAFLFFAIVNNLYRQESVQIISFTLIFLAMGISCFAVYQFLTHSNRVWDYVSPYLGRASGTYISPNNFAGFRKCCCRWRRLAFWWGE